VGITSKGFLILLGLVTLALAVATLWLWPRLAGHGAGPLAGRIGLLLGTQLSLAATFLLAVNAAGGFYTSWSQLFGDSSSKYHLSNAGIAAASAHDSRQLVVGADGRDQLTGLRSGVSAEISIFTPADYASAPEAGKSFAVEVVDLTGGEGGQPLPSFQQVANDYRLIVAVVTDSASTGSVPGVNVPEGTQGELFWSQDLRTALASHYRVADSSADWAVAGVGPAGCAAINLAVQDSTRYALAAAVGEWTGAPAEDSWPGIDRFLAGVPTPAVRLLYNPAAPNIPSRIRADDGPLQVATQPGLTLTGALDWLGASIKADQADQADAANEETAA
jgi:hypothetical protein